MLAFHFLMGFDGRLLLISRGLFEAGDKVTTHARARARDIFTLILN